MRLERGFVLVPLEEIEHVGILSGLGDGVVDDSRLGIGKGDHQDVVGEESGGVFRFAVGLEEGEGREFGAKGCRGGVMCG